jgi:CubicO group peptidase (beta-lactamase class C family)
MKAQPWKVVLVLVLAFATAPFAGGAGPASDALPVELVKSGKPTTAPVPNAAFIPGPDATVALEFSGTLKIAQSAMQTKPVLPVPIVDGRDARLFPAVALSFFTIGDVLVPVERGRMVKETLPAPTGKIGTTGKALAPSYWRVIPQFGRVWREKADGDWSRAAFPIMLVNDTENHAHQGLATFLYKNGEVTDLRLQFVQHTGPYALKTHFVAWGSARTTLAAGNPGDLDARRAKVKAELADRMPAKPWSELVQTAPPGTLDGFGGPLDPRWMVTAALVKDGVLYYQNSPTPYGDYPYPLEMRFGVRSATKSVATPLSLLRLAHVYGPWVLTLKVGDYVKGLHPKWNQVRFIDAANMATGFGGVGSLVTNPNGVGDSGYLMGNYDAWYLAHSAADKVKAITANWGPYPWEPGTVFRYRDQDFHLLGIAVDNFLKSVRGPKADSWEMLQTDVFTPIGIHHAPIVRTREPGGKEGVAWFQAGYYPTLEDLAKIATLFRNKGMHNGEQILHRQLTEDLLSAKDAIRKKTDMSLDRSPIPDDAGTDEGLYKMGFHFNPYIGSKSGRRFFLPTMSGSGANEVILFPNGLISIRAGKASELPKDEKANSGTGPMTAQAVDRLLPF